jgi:PAS domain S-box-containing protein
MGPPKASVSQDPFGLVLPLDVLGAAVEGFNDIVMVTETEPIAEPGLRVLFVNPAFERVTGYGAAEILGRSPRFMQGPGTSAEEILRIEAALTERKPVRAELLNYKKDGTPFWVEIEASTIRSPSTGFDYFVFIERDITERKRLDVAQHEQERAISTLFSNLPGMAYRCLNDGLWTMEFVSRGCRELTGFEPDALIGNRLTSYEEITEPEDRKAVREIITRAVERGEAYELTYRIRTRDGTLKWVWERGRSVPGPDGSVRSLEGFITDITERKLLESQVLQAQRIESIGTLAGGIAHDLNNVLAPIMMAGDLLADRAPDRETAQLLNVVSTSAKRGAELVRQILLFARGIEGPRVTVDCPRLLIELRTLLESSLPKSIRFNLEVAPGLPAISGDPVLLHQALLNLSVNARDAMPTGGRLSIYASQTTVSASSPRPHPDAVPGAFVRIDVSDTGCGIPDILKGQIFDPFFTTKGVGRGTGLGLSTARSIVKAHRGFITFVSTEGIGTTFSIFLPTDDSNLMRPAREEPAKGSPGQIPRGSGETILVVDDEESVRLMMRSTLENFGFKTVGAADGSEAVSLFRASPSLFQAAVVDMQMPGLDGVRTILALRHVKPDLAIIAASGLATSKNKEEAAANGVRHFLSKPFSIDTLIRTVHSAMAKAAP